MSALEGKIEADCLRRFGGLEPYPVRLLTATEALEIVQRSADELPGLQRAAVHGIVLRDPRKG